jgi:hypothetical protein
MKRSSQRIVTVADHAALGQVGTAHRLQAKPGRFAFTVAHEIGHWELHRPLFELVVEDGRMIARADLRKLFSGLGALVPAGGLAPALGGVAIVRERAQPPRWLNLGDPTYRDLLAAADQYDVFADERQRCVRKGTKVETGVQRSRFRSVFAALNSRAPFDPNVAGPDLTAGKQIFQRARQTFDIKSDGASWKIFKTVLTEEGHAVYTFQPDPDVSFAFIFLPGE